MFALVLLRIPRSNTSMEDFVCLGGAERQERLCGGPEERRQTDRSSMVLDIRKLDIYRKVPKDLTQPTLAGAIISITCVLFISFMVFNDILEYIYIDIRSELYVDDPGREGKIDVEVDVSFPYMKCEYLGVDIQDENGRHEVGFVDKTEKIPLENDGCRFKSRFEINKVPGNFHLSTHSAKRQPENYDMRHIIHSIRFGDEIPIVPSVYEDINGKIWNSYQYTFGHKDYLAYHHTGHVIPAIWFKYGLQPITVKHKEWRQSFYYFLTSICAVVGGTFTVAGIIDSTFFTISDIVKKHRLGKLS
ncbi:hypothetical protein NECAME_02411 [Necator americanus]|uniref:Endoplasmic reticulum-Golgi intermediate compartment protein 1 n=1 Tax=Necator americanus TaxID=51031 RepID=W2TFC9_NECAM|nr:hypothetical protein NECAME_02411 [Necator americanus]ETN80279.1 hypothetical protein NECAME_02411 [Necator americanus]